MFTSLQTRLKRASRWLPAMLLPFAAQAQVSPYTVSQTSGTYTAITGGTVLGSITSDDEQFNDVATPAGTTAPAPAAGLPVGFTFTLGGTAYDRFAVNNNGWIALGNSSAGATAVTARFAAGNYTPIATGTTPPANVIAAFAEDLQGQTGSQLSYSTVGTAPNRTLVVQWTNYQFYQNAGDSFNFQIRLNETASTIAYVYGAFTTALTPADGAGVQVGLRGATNTDFLTRTTTTTWAASTAGAANTDFMPVASTVIPATGLTYTFTPGVLPANDAAVTVIYTLGKVSSTYGSPVTVRAVVRNAGSATLTALPVTLTVSGATTVPATTQTVASLAPGATAIVTFPAYAVTGTSGINTVTVTVPADAVLTNNSQTYAQTITANDMAYVSGTTFAGGAGVAAANSIIAVKYLSTGPAAVTTVTPTFNGPGAATTTYQVLVYDATGAGGTPGALLYTSPTRNRPAAGGADPVTLPSISVSGAFFVAIKTLVAANILIAFQNEVPLRGNTFFFTTTNGTTWVDINTQTLTSRLAVDVTLGAPSSCGVVTALTAGSITGTGATISFTAPASGTSYTVTYTPAGGTATTVTPAPTASPVVLTGLTPGTTYTVSVTTNCAAGATSGAVTTTFSTPAVAPANDNCTAATVLPVAATCTPVNTTNTASTASPATVPAAPCGTAGGPDVWYALTVPASGALTVTTSASTNTTGRLTDTILQLYSGTCNALALIPNGCNDDFGTGFYSEVALIGLTPGTTIYARVFGFAGATGDFAICARAVTCIPVTALAAGSITATGATITFTPPAGASNYTVTYTAAGGGTPVTVTPPPTASPVVLTGLTTGTTYTVSVTTNCGTGQTSAAATTTFTTLGYCITGLGGSCGVNNVTAVAITATTLNATGLTCTTAGGQAYTSYPATGANTATLPRGGSYQLSVTVPSGNSVTVWIDSNRNLGFEPGEYTQITANSTTATVTAAVAIPATASVGQTRMRIRTRLTGNPNANTDACSSFGSGETKDFTINIGFGLGTRNEALAATVSLYPNPAHRAFTLDVPAGTLRTATATLHNALGQTVQTRQLSAAGSTTFDVSGLAAGVYSLELKAGDTLVVKRVVVE